METRSIAKLITALVFMLNVFQLSAQKKHLSTPQEVEAEIHSILNAQLIEEGSDFYKLKHKKELQGTYIIDISINDKSQVVSVFIVENNGGTTDGQVLLKDVLIDSKFKFKVPKGKRYKVRHTFIF